VDALFHHVLIVSQHKRKKESKLKPQVLARALKATRCGVVVTDPSLVDNPIVFANEAFCVMTGYAREEIVGRNCRFLQNKDRRQAQLSVIREALHAQKLCTVVVRNYKKSGELFFNELTISPIFNKSGMLTHFVGIQKDVTAEVQLKRQKDEFLATLLHDVKTPLLAAVRLIEHIENTEQISQNAHSLLESVRQNDQALLRLVENAIDCYRVERTEILNRIYYDLTQQLLKCAEQLSSHAVHKDVSVLVGSGAQTICADYRLCERGFSNLLELAIRYSPSDGRVKVKSSESDGFIELEFSNRSSRLPAKFLNLTQSLSLSCDEENGTAIALRASKIIMERHGGSLSVSRLNKVTTYTVRLPVSVAKR
jgi:PAS domain S-box-containing protein